MKLAEIITNVKGLDLPEGSYIVFGAGPLAAAGIRETSDIDLYVTAAVQAQKLKEGWQFLDKGGRDIPLVHDIFEMHINWNFGTAYNPSFTELQATTKIIEGVPFASLIEVYKWKVASARPKDLADIALIGAYLACAK